MNEAHSEPPRARRNVLMYRTHFWNDVIQLQVRKLLQAISSQMDIYVVGYTKPGGEFAVPPSVQKVVFTEHHIRALRFPTYCNIRQAPIPPRHLDMSLLHFFRMHPEYDKYWMIEFDIRYSGDWRKFFAEFEDNDADLLGTAVQRREENQSWVHWPTLCTGPDRVEAKNFVKSFTPVMRISNRGFEALNDAYARGWYGHYEAMWPTVLANAGYKIEEIGNHGSFTPADRRGKHYTTTPSHGHLWPGTLVFRPIRQESVVEQEADMLWHPVKTEHTPRWSEGAGRILE